MVNKPDDRSRQRAREDYVKGIYQLSGAASVRAVDLAHHLHVSRASVTRMRRGLESSGLVRCAIGRTDRIALTGAGARMACRIVRRHRLIETFLHRTLAVPLERIHDEAERIEHSISDDVATRLAKFLGDPHADPHGHPIPFAATRRAPRRSSSLADAHPGDVVIVTALDDRDAAAVKVLAGRSVLPGVRLRMDRATKDAVTVRAGRRPVRLSMRVARRVRCAPESSAS